MIVSEITGSIPLLYMMIVIGGIIYFILMMMSLSYSCGGYSFRDCGFCWVGIVQLPLNIIDWIYDKIKNHSQKG
jgi:hypothetical protein